MDLGKLTMIGYAGEALASPLSHPAFDRALDAAGLRAGDVVLDLGCGPGQAAAHMARRGAQVIGVERHALVAEAARERGRDAAPGSVDVRVGEASAMDDLPAADIVVAMGAGKLAGAQADAAEILRWLARRAKPGGALLWGETYWTREPSPVMARVAETAGGFDTNEGHRAAGAEAGLSLLHVEQSSRAERDDYTREYANRIVSYLDAHPDDPDAEAMANRARSWRALYEYEAGDATGFALYVWRTPA